MNIPFRTIIWQQFGAAIDMLENTLHACPDHLWRERLWDDQDGPEYGEFWFIIYHTLYWLDFYLDGAEAGFAPPAPFVAGSLPEKPYTRDELQDYLDHCRQKCRAILEMLTENRANQICILPWGLEINFVELQLYCMRHVQEHAAHLSLFLGRETGFDPGWVPKVGSPA